MNLSRPNPGAKNACQEIQVLENVPQPSFAQRRPTTPSAAQDSPGRSRGWLSLLREGGRATRPAAHRPDTGSRCGCLSLPRSSASPRHVEKAATGGSRPLTEEHNRREAAPRRRYPPLQRQPPRAPRLAGRKRPPNFPGSAQELLTPQLHEREQLLRSQNRLTRVRGNTTAPLTPSLPLLPSLVVPAVTSPSAFPRRTRSPGPAPQTRPAPPQPRPAPSPSSADSLPVGVPRASAVDEFPGRRPELLLLPPPVVDRGRRKRERDWAAG